MTKSRVLSWILCDLRRKEKRGSLETTKVRGIFHLPCYVSLGKSGVFVKVLLGFINVFHPVGLSTPVPRGRKGKNKSKHEESRSLIEKEISEMDLDPEKILRDKGYRKHLVRHCNK